MESIPALIDRVLSMQEDQAGWVTPWSLNRFDASIQPGDEFWAATLFADIVPSDEDSQSPAAYSRDTDRIYLPRPGHFKSTDDFMAVLFHELGHWTGERANRPHASTIFGIHTSDSAYEELIAECTSRKLCDCYGYGRASWSDSYVQGFVALAQGKHDLKRGLTIDVAIATGIIREHIERYIRYVDRTATS